MNKHTFNISHENGAFWRTGALNPKEQFLLNVTLDAHHSSAFRGNVSSQAVAFSALAGGFDYGKSIAAGLMTLGGMHAPLVATCRILGSEDSKTLARAYLAAGAPVPGWGNSFHKGEHDPEWVGVAATLEAGWPLLHARIAGITELLQGEAGKNVFPNPSAFTAAAALALGMPPELSPHLLVLGRLTAWAEIFVKSEVE